MKKIVLFLALSSAHIFFAMNYQRIESMPQQNIVPILAAMNVALEGLHLELAETQFPSHASENKQRKQQEKATHPTKQKFPKKQPCMTYKLGKNK